MPATSKAQFKFMQAVAHKGIKKPGLSPSVAKEYVSANKGKMSYKNLPAKSGFKKLAKMMKKD